MNGRKLEDLRVAALVTNGFEEIEFTSPRDALSSRGVQVKLVSPAADGAQSMNHMDRSARFEVDIPIEQANPDDFDALLLPGGVFSSDKLRVDPTAQSFVKRVAEQCKPIFVICHAAWLLISAGLVRGRRLATYHTLRDDIINAGGHWVDETVVNDGNITSSRGPQDLPTFNEHIIRRLVEYLESHDRKVVTMDGTE